MSDPTRPIETPEQLQEWIARHPERHRKMGTQECSCGWPGAFPVGDTTWEEHESVMLLHDLGDALPSDTWDDGPISWRAETEQLTEILDIFHENCKCEFEWPDK